jgi:hypothetical protein
VTDYAAITADPVRGPEIGRLYMDASPFITILARYAYAQFAKQVEAQYEDMTRRHGIRVEFQDDDPYPSYREMVDDVTDNRRLKIYRTAPDQAHPLLSADQNNMFRAVHDYFGHHGAGNGASLSFSRHGEEGAWVRHSAMFTGLARRAMTSETRGQNSAFIWINGGREFPEQKAILLPDWVSEVPSRWR